MNDPRDAALSHGLQLSACSCQCRQCGLSHHCSECYRRRRKAALQRALGRVVRP